MDAKKKNPRVMLAVRVPPELRAKLAQVARSRGSSITHELVELLNTQLPPDLSVLYQLDSLKREVTMYKTLLNSYEALLLRALNPTAIQDRPELLAQLYVEVVRARAMRAKSQRVIETRLRARAQEVKMAKVKKVSRPFDGLDKPNHTEDSQLSLFERRWANLRDVIEVGGRGAKKQLALALGWTPSQLSQLLSSPARKGHRTISDEVARKLERTLGLPVRELDKIEPKPDVVSLRKSFLSLDALIVKLR